MTYLWFLFYFFHSTLAGNLYSPASYAFPASTLVAPQPVSPLHYATPLRSSTGYGPLGSARVSNIAAPVIAPSITAAAVPAVYSAPVVARYPLPTAYAAPVAPVLGRIATPVLQKYAAVPTLADVPITRYEARPGFIQKYVDVAHSKVATTKIHIRRPAIQKQFYDIEERIVVRPIASAVVELDQPISKSQAGPTLVSPALPAASGIISTPPVPVSQLFPAPAYGPPQPLPPPSTPESPQSPPPSAPESPQLSSPSVPENLQFPFPSAPQNPQFLPPSAPQSPQFPETSVSGNGEISDDSDSITVENEDVRARMSMQQQPQTRQQMQPLPQAEEKNQQQNEGPQSEQPEQPQARSGLVPSAPQQTEARFGPTPSAPQQTQVRFLPRSQIDLNEFNNFPTQSRSVEDIIPSTRSQLTEEQSQSNQQRLIELLTGRGGIAEVRSGVSVDAASEVGQIRGRVLAVTPAPSSSVPVNERVSTRRVVVSRPIQTLQEIDVVQPFTKLQRLSVQHPAILKTPRVDIARVKTITPVPVTAYGAYTPYAYVH